MTLDLTPDQAEVLIRACQCGIRRADQRLRQDPRPEYRRFIEFEKREYADARELLKQKFPALTDAVEP